MFCAGQGGWSPEQGQSPGRRDQDQDHGPDPRQGCRKDRIINNLKKSTPTRLAAKQAIKKVGLINN